MHQIRTRAKAVAKTYEDNGLLLVVVVGVVILAMALRMVS
jgi:hypothetical protein